MLNYKVVKVTGTIVRKYSIYGIDRILKFKAFNLFNIILSFKIFRIHVCENYVELFFDAV